MIQRSGGKTRIPFCSAFCGDVADIKWARSGRELGESAQVEGRWGMGTSGREGGGHMWNGGGMGTNGREVGGLEIVWAGQSSH